jgi:hypothetical protein
MTDILDDSFAVVLLTRAELDGPLCRSPDALMARALSSHAAPHWLEVGSGRALFDGQLGNAFDRKAADLFLYKIFGVVPGARLDCSRSRKWSPRAQPIRTPARLPKIRFSGEKPYDGTMQPIQSTLKFSPFYVEFE